MRLVGVARRHDSLGNRRVVMANRLERPGCREATGKLVKKDGNSNARRRRWRRLREWGGQVMVNPGRGR